MKHFTIPIFIPELACPFQCIYCNQKNISSTLKIPSKKDIHKIIQTYLNTIDYKNSVVQIAYFGGNFTGINLVLQEELLELANYYVREYNLYGVRISTRPDYINQKILDLLKKYNVKSIELGAQSLVDDVLIKAGRGHTVNDVVKAAKLIYDNNFELGLQMMIGLPGDSKEYDIQTAKKIVNLGAKTTRIYPTLVIKDTFLEKMYARGEYQPLNLEEAVSIVKELLPIFVNNNVKILRIGLHPSEDLINYKSLIAGPFHQSFKELVLTEIWFDKLKNIVEKGVGEKTINIFVNTKDLNYAIGYKSKNKLYLQKYFHIVKFYKDDNIIPDTFSYNFS
ncbi:MAG TPA: radical SAM protein [Ignavibacteriales bacterium]|nr:radical SAM protein [Ignavibacteriales bacterium]HOL81142.1 radical SAM protein [Ignavibacteriales bacterium]HOM65245.1 radical SAM protein [Ignavibacteriales bacterium]HPD66537.1 radical SAM protein [Ignavibacteriales bacterium]HPP33502.1 radical SAM protein [Ignavibacteriales bacterium]